MKLLNQILILSMIVTNSKFTIFAASYDTKNDCRPHDFKCETGGECIIDDKICDGAIDCTDRSDETTELCLSYYCPSYGFRCTYGGCVEGSRKCDGKFDCADNSDEDPELCTFVRNMNKTTTLRPTTKATSVVPGSCLIPNNLPDTIEIYYEDDTGKEVSKGSYAETYNSVTYKCKGNYVIEGNTTNHCFEGEWVADHPVCRRYCSPLATVGVTIKPSCEFGTKISCMEPLPPESIAHINCAPGYRKPDRIIMDSLKCKEDGEWDKEPFTCEQICGEEAPEVLGEVNTTVVPWHVGIYSNLWNREDWIQISGGTIINAKLVISAANCFWDAEKSKFYAPENFKIAAGKYYRNFNAAESIKPQFLDIESIVHKAEYNGYAGYYAFDIALLILKDNLEFNHYVKPICIETNLNFNEKFVAPGTIGKVAGWDVERSEENSTADLKYIYLPAIQYNECKQNLTSEQRVFITGDKFCGGYTNGQSGGGFVYSKSVGPKKVYFLRGILNVFGKTHESDANNKYSLFTNIQYHIEMITYYESQYRPK